jgi:thiol:disulfide interchange protein DsbD
MARNDQRSIPVWLLALAGVLLAGRVALYMTHEEPPGRVQWLTAEQGMEAARASGMPVLIDFTADWCVPCHQLDAQVFQDPGLSAEINRRFITIRVTDRRKEEGRNAPAVDELQRRYSVNGFPTIVFADPNGTELARMEGFGGRRQFTQVMEQVR